MDHLFVYGTLMLKYPENPLRDLLEKHCVGKREATCSGDLFLVSTYPGLVSGRGVVFGEILSIQYPAELFKVLDKYENYFFEEKNRSQYIRTTLECVSIENEIINCWIYIYNRPTSYLNRIESGKFY